MIIPDIIQTYLDNLNYKPPYVVYNSNTIYEATSNTELRLKLANLVLETKEDTITVLYWSQTHNTYKPIKQFKLYAN
jgi:hypothetical protein